MPDQIIATTEETAPATTEVTPKRYRCRHIFTDGRRCGSPSLRGEPFCYYHHSTRGFADEKRHCRSWSEFELPPLEDRSSVLAAIAEVLQRIACGNLSSKQAGLLLYGLQIASLNLPKTDEAKPDDRKDPQVEEVITHPRFGDLAPIAEIVEQEAPPTPTQPEENPSPEQEQEQKQEPEQEQKQEQNRVPHLRDSFIVAKVGEAELTQPEENPSPEQEQKQSRVPHLRDSLIVAKVGEAEPTHPLTLPNLHASTNTAPCHSDPERAERVEGEEPPHFVVAIACSSQPCASMPIRRRYCGNKKPRFRGAFANP